MLRPQHLVGPVIAAALLAGCRGGGTAASSPERPSSSPERPVAVRPVTVVDAPTRPSPAACLGRS
jgi:hypothetical protein